MVFSCSLSLTEAISTPFTHEFDGCAEPRWWIDVGFRRSVPRRLIALSPSGDERDMKNFVTAMVLAFPLAAGAAKLELEIGSMHVVAPQPRALTARIGLDVLGHLTPSVRALTQSGTCCGRETWALLGELRAHTGGWLQLTAGLGLGVGTAYLAERSPDAASVRVQRAPSQYMMGDLGLRVMFRDFWVGAGVARSTGWDGYRGMLSVGWAPLKTGT